MGSGVAAGPRSPAPDADMRLRALQRLPARAPRQPPTQGCGMRPDHSSLRGQKNRVKLSALRCSMAQPIISWAATRCLPESRYWHSSQSQRSSLRAHPRTQRSAVLTAQSSTGHSILMGRRSGFSACVQTECLRVPLSVTTPVASPMNVENTRTSVISVSSRPATLVSLIGGIPTVSSILARNTSGAANTASLSISTPRAGASARRFSRKAESSTSTMATVPTKSNARHPLRLPLRASCLVPEPTRSTSGVSASNHPWAPYTRAHPFTSTQAGR